MQSLKDPKSTSWSCIVTWVSYHACFTPRVHCRRVFHIHRLNKNWNTCWCAASAARRRMRSLKDSKSQPVDHASWPECHTYLLWNRGFTVEETYHIKGFKQEWFNTKMCVSYLLSHRGCTAEESPTSIDWINKTTRRCVMNTHTKCVKNVWDGYHALRFTLIR